MKIIKYIFLILLFLFNSCADKFLEMKPERSMVIPQKLTDYEAILDNVVILNQFNVPFLGEVSADDLYLTDQDWGSLFYEDARNSYIWSGDIFGGIPTSYENWNIQYLVILYANIVIDGVEKFPKSIERDKVLGRALFFRAWNHFLLANLYSPQYEHSRAHTDLGIPLRLESDINLPSERGSLKGVYDQVLLDLMEASKYLPIKEHIKTRPSLWSVYALLSKVFLQMGDYNSALEYANNTLSIDSNLMNYNDIDSLSNNPFVPFNSEVIFHTNFYTQVFNPNRHQIASELYHMYNDTDLRKNLFFSLINDRIIFKGSYTGDSYLFAGLSIDEIYLIKMECLARIGYIDEAKELMNTFLKTRHRKGVDLNILNPIPDDILPVILDERRKQLVFRGIRWMDLKRLNLESRFETTLRRTVGNQDYFLEPQSIRYTFPLPNDVITIGKLKQNPR